MTAPTAISPLVRISAEQPGAVRHRPHEAELAREFLQVVARLAQLDPAALDLTHAKPLADERVQPHAARRELAPRLARREARCPPRRRGARLLALRSA